MRIALLAFGLAAPVLAGPGPRPAAEVLDTLPSRVVFEASASTGTITLGEHVQIWLRAAIPAGYDLRMDIQNSTTDLYALKPLEAPAAGGTAAKKDFKIEVFPLSTGLVPVRLAFTLDGPDGASLVWSPKIPIMVSEPPIDEEGEIRAIKSPRTARPLWPWWLAAALLLSAAAVYAWLKRKPPLPAAVPKPVDTRSPHEIAESDLDGLAASGLWADKQYKEFYHRLTDIVRCYLDGRYGIPAPHLTTLELTRHLRRAEVEKEVLGSVKEIFDRADLVKFAKTLPDAEIGPQDIENAKTMVQHSTPRDLAEAPGAKR